MRAALGRTWPLLMGAAVLFVFVLWPLANMLGWALAWVSRGTGAGC